MQRELNAYLNSRCVTDSVQRTLAAMTLTSPRPGRAGGIRALGARTSDLVVAARASGRLDLLSRALWLALIPGGLLFLAMQVFVYWQTDNDRLGLARLLARRAVSRTPGTPGLLHT